MLPSFMEMPNTTAATHTRIANDVINELNEQVFGRLLSSVPGGLKNHFFISHFQATGGDVAKSLHYDLKERGLSSWYDNNEENLTQQGMEEGVKNSACFLLLLTSGVLTREWVLKEFRWALQYKKPILLVFEQDNRMEGRHWDFSQTSNWKDTKGIAPSSGMVSGKEYVLPIEFAVLFNQDIPVPDYCSPNFRDCIPLQRRKYLVDGMVYELRKRAGIEAPSMVLSPQKTSTEIHSPRGSLSSPSNSSHGITTTPQHVDENPVVSFLNQLNLSQYYDIFMEEGWDDLDGIKLLTDNDLVDMGVTKKGHRRKLLSAALKMEPTRPSGSPRNGPGSGRAGQNIKD